MHKARVAGSFANQIVMSGGKWGEDGFHQRAISLSHEHCSTQEYTDCNPLSKSNFNNSKTSATPPKMSGKIMLYSDISDDF